MSCKAENSMQLLKHTDACHFRIYIKCLVESDETKYNRYIFWIRLNQTLYKNANVSSICMS